MHRVVHVTLVGSLLLVAAQCAMALGMGQVRTTSKLGDPLEFSVALSSQSGEALAEDCISADVFSGSSRVPDNMVRLRIDRSASGLPTALHVNTGTRIDEPLARIELAFNCGTSLRRSYVVFIDPPVLQLAQAGSEPAMVDTASPRPRPVVRRAPASDRARSARSASRSTGEARVPAEARSRSAGPSAAARQQRAAVAKAARQPGAATAEPPVGASSLKLESAAPAAATTAQPARPSPTTAAATSALAAASSALASRGAAEAPIPAATSSAAVSGLLGELAAKADADAQSASQEKVRLLEENLNKLRADNQSMQRSVADLQARLVKAEDSGVSMSVVYGLLGVLLLLLLAIAALLWRQASLRRESDWLKAAAAEEPQLADSGVLGAPRSIVRPSVQPSARGSAETAAAAARLAEAATKPGPRATLAAASAIGAGAAVAAAAGSDANAPAPINVQPKATPISAHEITAIQEQRREVSVDELIDLEQQADFFVVLGQDDAAIDLLMGHFQGTGGVSPLPYLKLLEIHRRRNEREAYDRVRERFNRRFAAFAPEWEAHSGHDRSLEDYPAVVEQLQKQWPTPSRAMDTLASLLFQRDDAAQTYDLPAYGELLFLYSVARELAERELPSEGVDLLLPLDGRSDFPAAAVQPVSAAASTLPMRLSAQVDKPDATRDRLDDLNDLPDLDWQNDNRPRADSKPLNVTVGQPGKKPADSNLLDLNIHDEPEEPKGPLS